MNVCDIKGQLAFPDADPEEIVVCINDQNMDEILKAVKTVQSTCNKILTEKIEDGKNKQPDQKKPRIG